VKAIKWGRKPQWRSDARTWMDIRLDEETGVQNDLGDKSLAMPDLIYVLVALAPPDPQPGKRDRFFILTMAELQAILARGYRSWMRGQGWRRPRTQDSYDIHYGPESVAEYEDNWDLITRRLQQ
jgi:hypothetical protein